MGQLQIYGASDDLVDFDGHVSGEVGCYESPVTVVIGEGNAALGVWLRHTGKLGWIIGCYMPADVDADRWTAPSARLSIEPIRGDRPHYCPVLTVDVPDGAPVQCFVDGVPHEIC